MHVQRIAASSTRRALGRSEDLVAAYTTPANCQFPLDFDVLERRASGGTAKGPGRFPHAGSILDILDAKAARPLWPIGAARGHVLLVGRIDFADRCFEKLLIALF
jgi:hypothetical protein